MICCFDSSASRQNHTNHVFGNEDFKSIGEAHVSLFDLGK